ncbi:MAG TPA: hypothetical protein VI997_05070 [Candidatus Thermoplasmatota archaeon]|nr:hypothetical protein [Candidatus Thermoplasmatota archaeon]
MRAPALAVLVLLFAGCLQPDPEPVAAQASEPIVILDEARPDTSFGEIVTGPAVGPDLNATTAAPPRLVRGEWWRIEFSSGVYEGTDEVVRVVADVYENGYVFGMPHEGWFKEAISYHAPAFGDVDLALSYATHNELFEPVRFPLEEGATWETVFATSPYVATVESADETIAVIRFDTAGGAADPVTQLMTAAGAFPTDTGMRLTYDAQQHEVVKFESVIGMWEVVEHGYGFEGWVTVPRGEHTAIDYGTFGPASPGEPVVRRSLEVSGGFNRLTMMHLVLPITAGAYRLTSVPPVGDAFVTEVVGQPAFTLRFYEARDPDGTWQQEDLVGGVGATYSMGIAYHQYDIRLPDGARRTDHSHPVIR